MAVTLDLDALKPQDKTVRFNGVDIIIKPLTTEQMLRLGALGIKMQEATKLGANELSALANDMRTELELIVPDLIGKDIASKQLFALLEFIIADSEPDSADSRVQPDLKAVH